MSLRRPLVLLKMDLLKRNPRSEDIVRVRALLRPENLGQDIRLLPAKAGGDF